MTRQNKKRMNTIVILCLILLLGLYIQWDQYYYKRTRTIIFTDQTKNGHQVVIYEIGHNRFDFYHQIILAIDEKILLSGSVVFNNTDISLFPTDNIVCTENSEEEYNLFFDSQHKYWSCTMSFDGDFSVINKIDCWDLEIADQNIRVLNNFARKK